MKPLAIYLRKSRADDVNERMEETLKKHKETLFQYLRSKKLNVIPEDIYEEVVSGDSLYARPEMLRMLEKVEEGYYSAVVCLDIQRLGRGSMKDQGIILEAFKRSETKIITPLKTYDLNDDSDETYTEFEQFMGRQELKMIKRRLLRGKRQVLENGGYTANAPYGYQRCTIDKKPSLRIIDEEAQIIRQMYDMYVYQGMGASLIAEAVNGMGAKPRRVNAFSRTTVRTILSNPVYTGKVVWDRTRAGKDKKKWYHNNKDKWLIYNGLHEPIIDEALFEKAQSIRESRAHSPSFTGRIENPLAGLIRCKNCGAIMQRQDCKQGGYYLLCNKKGCMAGSKLSYVEEAVFAVIKNELKRLRITIHEQEKQVGPIAETIANIDRNIEQAKRQIANLQDLLEQNIYDTSTYYNRKNTLDGRIARLQATKEKLTQPHPKIEYDTACSNIADILNQYDKLDASCQNRVLKEVIDVIYYDKKKGAAPNEFTLDLRLKLMSL